MGGKRPTARDPKMPEALSKPQIRDSVVQPMQLLNRCIQGQGAWDLRYHVQFLRQSTLSFLGLESSTVPESIGCVAMIDISKTIRCLGAPPRPGFILDQLYVQAAIVVVKILTIAFLSFSLLQSLLRANPCT